MIPGIVLPFQFCKRLMCDGARVNPDYPMEPGIRAHFQNYLYEREHREVR